MSDKSGTPLGTSIFIPYLPANPKFKEYREQAVTKAILIDIGRILRDKSRSKIRVPLFTARYGKRYPNEK